MYHKQPFFLVRKAHWSYYAVDGSRCRETEPDKFGIVYTTLSLRIW